MRFLEFRRIDGAWFFVEPMIEEALTQAKAKVKRARYAGRAAAASPATGLAKRHQTEQAALVADALGHNVREEIRRTRKNQPARTISECTVGRRSRIDLNQCGSR